MSKPFRIGLVMQGGSSWMGGAEYIKNIVLALASLPEEVRATFEICLICEKTIDLNILNQLTPHLADIFYFKDNNILQKIARVIRRDVLGESNTHLSQLLEQNPVHSMDFIYPYFTNKTYAQQLASAAWIPDFQHKYLTEFFTEKEIQARDKAFEITAINASTVVLSSESARSDFHKFFPSWGYKAKVLSFTTIPSPIWYEMDPIKVLKQYNLPKKFFLIGNQFWQHKNHLTVFRALRLLHDRGIYPTVICTGSLDCSLNKSWKGEILESIEKLNISSQVYLLGVIPKVDQIQLLRASLAVIQPSLFEGWSTIVEESKCFGKKIILSDLPVHIEQNPSEGVFFQKDSPEILSEILASCWNEFEVNLDLSQEQIDRQANFKRVQAFAYDFLDIMKKSPSV